MSGRKNKVPTFRYFDKKKNKDKKKNNKMGESKISLEKDKNYNDFTIPNNEFIKIIPLNDKNSGNKLNESSTKIL